MFCEFLSYPPLNNKVSLVLSSRVHCREEKGHSLWVICRGWNFLKERPRGDGAPFYLRSFFVLIQCVFTLSRVSIFCFPFLDNYSEKIAPTFVMVNTLFADVNVESSYQGWRQSRFDKGLLNFNLSLQVFRYSGETIGKFRPWSTYCFPFRIQAKSGTNKGNFKKGLHSFRWTFLDYGCHEFFQIAADSDLANAVPLDFLSREKVVEAQSRKVRVDLKWNFGLFQASLLTRKVQDFVDVTDEDEMNHLNRHEIDASLSISYSHYSEAFGIEGFPIFLHFAMFLPVLQGQVMIDTSTELNSKYYRRMMILRQIFFRELYPLR